MHGLADVGPVSGLAEVGITESVFEKNSGSFITDQTRPGFLDRWRMRRLSVIAIAAAFAFASAAAFARASHARAPAGIAFTGMRSITASGGPRLSTNGNDWRSTTVKTMVGIEAWCKKACHEEACHEEAWR